MSPVVAPRARWVWFVPFAFTAAWSLHASGQEIQLTGPLRAAPAGYTVMRRDRFAVSAIAGSELELDRKPSLLLGGEALYHPKDWIGAGVFGAGAIAVGETTHEVMRGLVSPELVLIPLHGRGVFFEKLWCAIDLHVEVGPAWIWRGRSGDSRLGAPSVAPVAGLGLLTFWSYGGGHWSVGVDYRAAPDARWSILAIAVGLWPQEARWDDDDD